MLSMEAEHQATKFVLLTMVGSSLADEILPSKLPGDTDSG